MMPNRYRLQIPNSVDIEFGTYEEAIYTLSRIGVDDTTLAELDEDGNVLSTLSNDELKTVVSEFKDLSSLSVYYQSPKGRLVEDE